MGADGVLGLEPTAPQDLVDLVVWLFCLAAYFQMGSAQKGKALEALERAKSCVASDCPLLLMCCARAAELQGHKDDALNLYTAAAACNVASTFSHPLMRYHSPELYLGRW